MVRLHPSFIVRRAPYNGSKVGHFIGPELRLFRIAKTRATGRTIGGMFREVETLKEFRTDVATLRISGLDGRGMKRDHGVGVRLTAAEVKKVVRRVRPDEQEQLDQADEKIAALDAQLKAARDERAAIAAEAWQKAHVVTLAEVKALIT